MTLAPDEQAFIREFHTRWQEADERYERIYGRHPYTDLWRWAEAMVAWREQTPIKTWRRLPALEPGDRPLLVAAVAEALRLATRNGTPLGDVYLGYPYDLHNWLYPPATADEDECPPPGGLGWPAPTGAYAEQWHHLMQTVDADPVCRRRIDRNVIDLLDALGIYASSRPHHQEPTIEEGLESGSFNDPVYMTVASVAPSLGIGPINVADPSRYERAGMEPDAVEQAA
ncbi:hypothetical protein ACFXJ5_09230 [Streptomyces sp. NPDC059373]